jgi:hypothetical protein
MRLQLTSLRLTAALKTLANNARSAGRFGAVLEVPPDLGWWYYQEFGTATHFDPGDHNGYIPPSSHPDGYFIYPLHGKGLKLRASAAHPEETIIPHVGPPYTQLHPGVEPKSFVRRVLNDIDAQSANALVAALVNSQYDFQAVKNALLGEVMDMVKNKIVSSMAESLHAEPDGKLNGAEPAQVFEAAATVRAT